MNKAIEIDPQDMSAYSSSSIKSPVTILNEYGVKNHLVPHYNLIHDGSSLSKVSFKYSVNLDKFVAVGEGNSKQKAKQLAASNLLKKITNNKPQLLNTEFNECTISPYDKNIKLNPFFTKMNIANEVDQEDTSAFSSSSKKHPVIILNDYATKNQLVPHYNLIHDVSSLSIVSYKYIVTLDKFVAEGSGLSKKEAKHLAVLNLLKQIIDDKPHLLNTDFKEFAISPYDNNIKLNPFFTKMNTTNEVDQQDTSKYSTSLNKHPIAILNEYATKNHLVPRYNLIHDGSLLSIISFKYSVNLDKFVAVGEGRSKKEAKHLAALNLLKQIIDDKPQLLNTDSNECTISPYDKNIKVNYIGQLDDLCTHENSELPKHNLVKEEGQGDNKLFTGDYHDKNIKVNYIGQLDDLCTHENSELPKHNLVKEEGQGDNKLFTGDYHDKNIKVNYIGQLDDLCTQKNSELPKHNLVKEEGPGHNKLFTGDYHAAKIIETATTTKKEAKYLAAFQMVNSLMCSDIVVEKSQENMEIKKSITMHSTCEDYHLVFKNTEWKNSGKLKTVVNHYIKNGEFDLPDPSNILKKIIEEHKNMHITSIIEKIEFDSYLCTFVLTDVCPNVYGWGVDTNSEKAQHIAVKQLLTNICELLK